MHKDLREFLALHPEPESPAGHEPDPARWPGRAPSSVAKAGRLPNNLLAEKRNAARSEMTSQFRAHRYLRERDEPSITCLFTKGETHGPFQFQSHGI